MATFVVAFFVCAFFFVPWQRKDSNEIHWAPFYRAPITLKSTLRGTTVYNEYARVKGRPFVSLYLLQLAGIAGTGALVYRLVRAKNDPE